MKSQKKWIIAAILFCMCLFPNFMVRADNDVTINESIAIFIQCIKKHDVVGFRKLVSPSGLIIIRNFVTGGFGTRGKNIRYFYRSNEINEFNFNVPKEEPVSIEWLFAGTLKSKINKISIIRAKGLGFNFKDNGEMVSPSTMEIINICTKVQNFDNKSEMKPEIFVLNNREFALTESEYVISLSVGGWAVFERISKKYYLRAIMDFR